MGNSALVEVNKDWLEPGLHVDLGEGPWQTFEEAFEFAENEVRQPWRLDFDVEYSSSFLFISKM